MAPAPKPARAEPGPQGTTGGPTSDQLRSTAAGPDVLSKMPSGPGRDWKAWPGALRASVAFGVVGAVLLVAGFVSGSRPVLVAATTVGTLSLVSALVWRGQLIEAWRKEKGRPTRQW